MTVLWCPCGNDLYDSTDNLPYKARFASDEHMYSEDWGWDRLMYECNACGRLLIQARPDENVYLSYVPESPRREILRHEGAAREE